MIVQARVGPGPAEGPQVPRDVVVDAASYEDAVAQIDAQLSTGERVMYYRADDAESRWQPHR